MPDTPRFRIGNRHPHQGSLFRTRLCKYGDLCEYGERCYFAHSEDELRPRMLSQRDFPIVTPEKYSDTYIQSPNGGSDMLGDIVFDRRETIQRNSLLSSFSMCGFLHADNEDGQSESFSEASTSSSPNSWLSVIEYLRTAYLPAELANVLINAQPVCYSD